MIREIINLFNENGKTHSLKSNQVKFSDIYEKEIHYISGTESSNEFLLFVKDRNSKEIEIYQLLQCGSIWELHKSGITFFELTEEDFKNGN